MHSAAAQAIHRERRCLDRDTGPQANVARAVERISGGLLGVAEHNVIEFLGIKPGAFDRTLTGDGAQFLGGKVLQLAAVAAKGRARPADDSDVSRFQHGDRMDVLRAEKFSGDELTFQFNSGGEDCARRRGGYATATETREAGRATILPQP